MSDRPVIDIRESTKGQCARCGHAIMPQYVWCESCEDLMVRMSSTRPLWVEKPDKKMSDELCARCKCCSVYWDDCEVCGGDGVDGHDCGEDTCCCDDDSPNVRCDYCQGKGGHYVCLGLCDQDGKHDTEVSL